MLFETIRVVASGPCHLDWHLRRMAQSAAAFGFSLPAALTTVENLASFITDQIEAPITGRWRCRLDYGPNQLSIQIGPYQRRLIEDITLVEVTNLAYAHKFSDRQALEASCPSCHDAMEAVFVRDGCFLEGRYANIGLVFPGRILTPAACLLPGSARARLLAEGSLELADCPVERTISQADFQGLTFFNALIDPLEILLRADLVRNAVRRWQPESA